MPRSGRLTWLILVYRLPAHSSLKASIRRRLAAVGAVYPANAVAAVPASPASERAFRRIRSMIGEAGGSAQVMRAEAIEGAAVLTAMFHQAREQEYAEIIAGCHQVLAGIEALTAAGRSGYADLEDQEAELKRLSARQDAVRTRDATGAAANAELALAALATCRAAVDDFAAHVYQTDAGGCR